MFLFFDFWFALTHYFPQIVAAMFVLAFWRCFYVMAKNTAERLAYRHTMRKGIRAQQKVFHLR